MTARAALDAYLESAGKQARGTPAPDPPPELTTGTEAERLALIVELIARRRADEYHGPAFSAAEDAWGVMLLSLKPLSEAAVCAVARAVGATGSHLCGYPWRFVWKEAQALIAKDGVTEPVHDALRAMSVSMNVHTSDKHAACEIDRALWFETFSKLDPAVCAADVIRRDLRRLAEKKGAAWRAALAVAMGVDRAEPKPTFDKKIAKPLAALVAAEDVDERATAWLDELAALDEVRLSPAGADAFRALVWLTGRRPAPPRTAMKALAARPWKRGKHWGPRQDRFIGAIAWGLRVAKVRGARPALESLQAKFGKTTAKYAIELALADA